MRASHAEGMGPVHQRERENLKGDREKKQKNKCVCCGGRGGGTGGRLALTGLTHALTLTALGEENRTSYPRGPQKRERGEGE